jgi:predicted ATP-grasp superfamily ATP-dependent carboligase
MGHGTYIGTIKNSMDVIRTERKGRNLNILRKYHIYRICKNLHMNDTHVEAQNHIFQRVHELYNR